MHLKNNKNALKFLDRKNYNSKAYHKIVLFIPLVWLLPVHFFGKDFIKPCQIVHEPYIVSQIEFVMSLIMIARDDTNVQQKV